jgi:hypothetical protein
MGIARTTRSFTVREVAATVLPVVRGVGTLRLPWPRLVLGRDDLVEAIETGEVHAAMVGDTPDDWIVELDTLLPWINRMTSRWDAERIARFNRLPEAERRSIFENKKQRTF